MAGVFSPPLMVPRDPRIPPGWLKICAPPSPYKNFIKQTNMHAHVGKGVRRGFAASRLYRSCFAVAFQETLRGSSWPSWPLLAVLEPHLGHLGVILALLGLILASLRLILAVLGPILAILGLVLAILGLILGILALVSQTPNSYQLCKHIELLAHKTQQERS